jgi:hypothetical protein
MSDLDRFMHRSAKNDKMTKKKFKNVDTWPVVNFVGVIVGAARLNTIFVKVSLFSCPFFGATTFSIMTLSNITLTILGLFVTLSINDIQHNSNMVSVAILYLYAECRYAECRYAECLYAECLYVECRYAECRYAECHYAECLYAECRYAERRGANGHLKAFAPIRSG